MKYLILLITAIIIFSACSHNIPIANIEFVKIEKDKEVIGYFDLHFSSDIELIDNLQEKHVGARLKCFFNKKGIDLKDFDNYNKYILKSIGNLEIVSNSTINKEIYNYKINVSFRKYEQDGSSDILDEDNLSEIIKIFHKEPNCLSCVVTAVTYLQTTKRYISNTMCLPKSEIIKVMKN